MLGFILFLLLIWGIQELMVYSQGGYLKTDAIVIDYWKDSRKTIFVRFEYYVNGKKYIGKNSCICFPRLGETISIHYARGFPRTTYID
jgi:hypothetical protein